MLKYIIAILAITSLTLNAAEGPKRPWDADGDKALNKTEWLARAAARFEMFDTNKDGVVTIAEAKAGRAACEQHREQRREQFKEHRKENKK